MTITDTFIDEIQQVEARLIETGIVVLPTWSRKKSPVVPTPTMQKVMQMRAAELGWHPIVVHTFTVTGDTLAGWISIPASVFRRGLGADLSSLCDKHNAYGSGKYAALGRREFTPGKTVHKFAFGSEGQLVLDWVGAQDPRITKVLITKRGK